ncbi:MAG: hypothetical protein IT367_00045, partial [Candidatus Hydrogenedentes bacterium]|nr:hypothetical protein [Candidatus Hydrogenedentota bacterium]
MKNILQLAAVFIVLTVTHGLFGHWLLTLGTFLILILSPPGHAIAQACLVLVWITLYTGTEFAIEYPAIAQESTLRFGQIAIWMVAWLRGKHIANSQEMAGLFVHRHARFVRRVL